MSEVHVNKIASIRVCTDLEKSWKTAFFWKNHRNFIFLLLSWKSRGFFLNHAKLKNTLVELLLGCVIVVFPKLAQNFDPQSAEIWPHLQILEATLFGIGM